jgi:hypothetical protein
MHANCHVPDSRLPTHYRSLPELYSASNRETFRAGFPPHFSFANRASSRDMAYITSVFKDKVTGLCKEFIERSPCGGGLEYLHRSPTSRRRRRNGNPVPGGITGPPCPEGYKYGDLALQVGESAV